MLSGSEPVYGDIPVRSYWFSKKEPWHWFWGVKSSEARREQYKREHPLSTNTVRKRDTLSDKEQNYESAHEKNKQWWWPLESFNPSQSAAWSTSKQQAVSISEQVNLFLHSFSFPLCHKKIVWRGRIILYFRKLFQRTSENYLYFRELFIYNSH